MRITYFTLLINIVWKVVYQFIQNILHSKRFIFNATFFFKMADSDVRDGRDVEWLLQRRVRKRNRTFIVFLSTAYKREKDFSGFPRCGGQSPPPQKTVRFLLAKTGHITVYSWFGFTTRPRWRSSHICRIKYPPQTGQLAIRLTKNSHVLSILCSYFSLFGIDARDRSRLFTGLLLEEAYSRSKLLTTFRTLK